MSTNLLNVIDDFSVNEELSVDPNKKKKLITKTELQNVCSNFGLPTWGTKKVLIDRMMAYYESEAYKNPPKKAEKKKGQGSRKIGSNFIFLPEQDEEWETETSIVAGDNVSSSSALPSDSTDGISNGVKEPRKKKSVVSRGKRINNIPTYYMPTSLDSKKLK